MKDFLTAEEIQILEEAHRAAQDKRKADRIKTVLALNTGLTYKQIAKLLLLDGQSDGTKKNIKQRELTGFSKIIIMALLAG